MFKSLIRCLIAGSILIASTTFADPCTNQLPDQQAFVTCMVHAANHEHSFITKCQGAGGLSELTSGELAKSFGGDITKLCTNTTHTASEDADCETDLTSWQNFSTPFDCADVP